jgi:hypothetical protein
MARTSVTTQAITRAGVVPTASAPTAEGDIIDTGGRVFLLVSNTGDASATVTIDAQATVYGLDVEDLAVTLAAGETRAIGPLPTQAFGFPKGDENAGRAFVDYTGTVADLTRSVLSL